MKNPPSPEMLRKLLRYEPDTGKLYWRERKPDMFEDGVRHTAEHICRGWNTRYAGHQALCTNNGCGYFYGEIYNRPHLSHRVIWAIVTGSWPIDEIDHISGEKKDNRVENLRDVPRVENARNRSIHSNNTSGALGVYWHKANMKWVACIWVGGKNLNLGSFTDKSKAIEARHKANLKHGFHANHGRTQ